MTTPKRPSLADTLARIDAVLADLKTTTAAEAARLDEAVADHAAKVDAQPPCLRCARKSLIDSPFCAYHLPCPIDQDPTLVCPTCGKRGRDRTMRDVGEDPQCVDCLRGLQLDVRPPGGITENGKVLPWTPYLQPALDEAARHLPGPPGPTCPGCAARDAQPGWLARALRRLFT